MPQDDLRELYQDMILDHGKHPRNFRVLDPCDHQALGHNPLCGDRLVVFLKLGADGRIEDAAFQGAGCAIAVASASLMTDMVRGASPEQAQKLFNALHTLCTGGDAKAMLADLTPDQQDRLHVLAGVQAYPVRVKCATLAWHALRAALASHTPVADEEYRVTTEE